MSALGSAILSAILLAASPGSPGDAGPGPQMNIRALSNAAGLLGAAVGCDEIAHARVSAAAGEIGALATANAITVEEVSAINRVLMASAVAGWQAVKDGKADCKTVEASFDQLEQIVVQTPVAQRRE